MLHLRLCLCLSALAGAALPAYSQSLVMSLPRQSQRSSVSQRVALTDITITYHRPLAGGRKIWGVPNLAPYDKVWRAGANENTTFEVSDPVTVEGQRLERGFAIGRMGQFVAFALEEFFEDEGSAGIVFNDKNAPGAGRGRTGGRTIIGNV